MFMTVTAFITTGILFTILQFFISGIWVYFVPSALIALTIWLKIIQPAWNVNNFQTILAKTDPSAASGYLWVISVIYGIISLFLGNWIPFGICMVAFIIVLTMKFPHPY